MKNKLLVFSTILLISIMVAGGTLAWFTSTTDQVVNNFEIGIIKVKVIKNGIEDIKIKSLGTNDSYIRVRLVPQWSNPNLSIGNVNITTNTEDWKYYKGYYYYKKILKENEITSNLINTINIDSQPEYDGASFTLKVVAEGVQSAHEAWRDVWSISNLPF